MEREQADLFAQQFLSGSYTLWGNGDHVFVEGQKKRKRKETINECDQKNNSSNEFPQMKQKTQSHHATSISDSESTSRHSHPPTGEERTGPATIGQPSADLLPRAGQDTVKTFWRSRCTRRIIASSSLVPYLDERSLDNIHESFSIIKEEGRNSNEIEAMKM